MEGRRVGDGHAPAAPAAADGPAAGLLYDDRLALVGIVRANTFTVSWAGDTECCGSADDVRFHATKGL